MFGLLAPKLSSLRTGDAAGQLIAEYGAVLEAARPGVEDISVLPASKPALKAAICEALRDPAKSKLRKPLERAYTMLSAYQPLSEQEKLATAILAKPKPRVGSEEERATAFAFLQVADAFAALQARVDAERKELASDMQLAGSR